MRRVIFHRTAWVLAAAVWMVAAGTRVRAQEVTYTGSVQVATGQYIFSERTYSAYLFNGLAVSTRRVQVGVNVPLIYQSTPWVSYGAAGAVPSGGMQHGSIKNQPGTGGGRHGKKVVLADTVSFHEVGVGDPSAQATLTLRTEAAGWPAVRLQASAKVPLADPKRGFGTGAWDVGGGLALLKQLGGLFVFVDVMYWVLGDLDDLALKDPVSYSIALGHLLRQGRLGVMASLSGSTEIIEGTDPPLQLTAGLTQWLQGGHGLSGSVSFGLTESSPDVSFSLGWRVVL